MYENSTMYVIIRLSKKAVLFIFYKERNMMMIYLDNSATTIAEPSVVASFKKVTEQFYANPSSVHYLGAEVEQLQQRAREQAANLLHIEQDEAIFTSGGTEANNIALKGIALQYQQRGKHIITTEIEHASVYETCKSLESLGFTVTYLPVNEAGVVSVEAVEAAITDETILISIMHANNEIGSIQPIEQIGEKLKNYPKVYFHVDAIQSLGKLPLHLTNSGIDLCSFSGHKIHGLNGTGLLYIRSGLKLFPLFHGGSQEFSKRAGTENVAGNVSFVRALRLIKEQTANYETSLVPLQTMLRDGLKNMEHIVINSPENAAAHIMNISIPGIKPEVMIHQLAEAGIILSTQSACSSKQTDESRVLSAIGASKAIAVSGLRISLAYDTTEEDINIFLIELEKAIKQLKEIMETI